MKLSQKFRRLASSAVLVAILSVATLAKDAWIQVRSPNFVLLGNASEKDIRKVANRLEQFREMFRQLFLKTKLTPSVPVNVVIFKSDSAYRPFKPKRADGKIDDNIAGYFQPGEDVNYISLSTEGNDADTFGVIFHEYVHLIVGTNFGKSRIPPWFNEGLAEYYETFQIVNDQKVKLGLPQDRHIRLLRDNRLMPLEKLFAVTNYELAQSGDHSRSIFYAESWALVHYLMQTGKTKELQQFLDRLKRNEEPRAAFEAAFNATYAQTEKALIKYVGGYTFTYGVADLSAKLTFDDAMKVENIPESLSDAYLGDLLYHINRYNDAEPYLQAALKLDPDSSMANATMGMVRIRQHRLPEAKTFLEKAVSDDRANHLALFRYAYLLSTESLDAFGNVSHFDEETANKMRELLKKAISIKPDFTESYELLAFVNLVNGVFLGESLALLDTAMKYQPGNQRYALRAAEIMFAQRRFDEAASVAERIGKTADQPEIKKRAESLKLQISKRKSYEASIKEIGKDQPDKRVSEEELARRQLQALYFSITESLRKPQPGEERIIGHIKKIECGRDSVSYSVKAGDTEIMLKTRDLQSLKLNTFTGAASGVSVGCGSDISALNAVITYATAAQPGRYRGHIVEIDFVPDAFRFVTSFDDPGSSEFTQNPANDLKKRASIVEAIRNELRVATAGEGRKLGYLNRIDCTSDITYFTFDTAEGPLRLLAPAPKDVPVRLFTRDLGGMAFGCDLRSVEIPAVFIYSVRADPGRGAEGELRSIDFVPRFFTLE